MFVQIRPTAPRRRPQPTAIRRLDGNPRKHAQTDSQWARVLSIYVAQLSPDFVVQAAASAIVPTYQIGALLALTATELRVHIS